MNRLTRTVVWFGVFLLAAPATSAQEPASDAPARTAQTVLLEATRQEMIAFRLKRVAQKFEYLARDLRSNSEVADNALGEDLRHLASRLKTVRQKRIADLRSRLKKMGEKGAVEAGDLLAVRREVRNIVRELAILLLEAGVRHATNVFVSRLDDLINDQKQLMDSERHSVNPAQKQRTIASEIEELLDKLSSLRRPLDRPLAAVRLARARKRVKKSEPFSVLRRAAEALEENNPERARDQQSRVLKALKEARADLGAETTSEKWTSFSRRRVTSAGQLKRLKRYQDRQLDLVSELEQAGGDTDNRKEQTTAARRQLGNIRGLLDALPEDGKWSSSIRIPLKEAKTAMENAVSALENGNTEKALRESRTVIGSFRTSSNWLERQVKMLEDVESQLKLATDMHRVAGYLSDVEAEQKDLRDKQEADPEEKRETQRVIRGATRTLLETVSGITEATPAEKPMRNAEELMKTLLEEDDLKSSRVNRLRKKTANALGTAGDRSKKVADRAEYVAEWLQYLGERQAALLSLLSRQIELRKRTEDAPERVFDDLQSEQKLLLEETRVKSKSMEIGSKHFEKAKKEMNKAIPKLKSKKRAQAVRHQRRAEEALRAAGEALASMVDNVAELSQLIEMEFAGADIHVLSRLMLIAVEQRQVRGRTKQSTAKQLKKFAWPEQMRLMRVTRQLAADEEIDEFPAIDQLSDAADEMKSAGKDLKQGNRSNAVDHQRRAEQLVREDIAELAGELLEVQDVAPPVEGKASAGSGVGASTSMPMEAVTIFGKPPPHVYEESKGGKTTWEPLSPRERAALNENFARELPLSYRSLLKAYYRSLSE